MDKVKAKEEEGMDQEKIDQLFPDKNPVTNSYENKQEIITEFVKKVLKLSHEDHIDVGFGTLSVIGQQVGERQPQRGDCAE